MNETNATLVIHVGETVRRLTVRLGMSVRDALDTSELRVRAACGGTGSCGACQVRLVGGAVSPHSVAEYQKLTPEDRGNGLRLACQLRLKGNAEICLDDPAPPSEWQSIPPENLACVPGSLPELDRHIYGLAVDLGTTHIRIGLWDRKRGRRIATRRGTNPQGVFGADVLNRLEAALVRSEHAEELSDQARCAIVDAVRDMLARDVGEVSPMLAEIGEMLIVGNTAMLALLTQHGAPALMDPDNWQKQVDCRPRDEAVWRAQWHMPHVSIVMPDPIAGFIGSDLLADLVATDLASGAAGSLLLDLGTNTEIALWDGNRLLVTSVPGGPAFEGVGIRNGMPAVSGAIFRVRQGECGLACSVIGAEQARGLCGSGLVDAIAVLLGNETLKPSGRFAAPPGNDGFLLIPDNPRSGVTAGDVDAFQRAKAATAAGMAQLLRLAGMNWGDVRRLCVCGAFGHQLEIAHAQAVGLLPPVKPSLIELKADASLAGCEQALLRSDAEGLFARLNDLSQPINLSYVEEYDDLYIDNLRLKPIPASD